MLSLKKGLAARHYWSFVRNHQRQHAAPVDREHLKQAIAAAHPGMEAKLAELKRDGVTVLEGYWPSPHCTAARAELDELMRSQPDCVRRFSNNSDKRMFGAEAAGPTIREFHDDPFLKSVGEFIGGLALYNFATLGARIDATDANRGSGDGWHRDAFGFQFKAIMYLSDVTSENGPFQYLRGSHKAWRASLDSALGRFPVPPDSRIDTDTMEQMIADRALQPSRFTAKAGTVILANTAGVHGGARLKSGHRYALTNYYYFPYQIGQSLLDKFEPLVPGVKERLNAFVEAESGAGKSQPVMNREPDYA